MKVMRVSIIPTPSPRPAQAAPEKLAAAGLECERGLGARLFDSSIMSSWKGTGVPFLQALSKAALASARTELAAALGREAAALKESAEALAEVNRRCGQEVASTKAMADATWTLC